MARASDFLCVIAMGPASALVAIMAGLLIGWLGGGAAADEAIFAGMALFVVLPAATIVLRARVRGLTLGWTGLLIIVTLVSMAATMCALLIALSLAYAHFMGDF
jgi:hypothetical protein